MFSSQFSHLIRDKFNKRILIKDSLQAPPQRGIWDPHAFVAAMGGLNSLPNIKQLYIFFLKNLIKKMDLIGDHIMVTNERK